MGCTDGWMMMMTHIITTKKGQRDDVWFWKCATTKPQHLMIRESRHLMISSSSSSSLLKQQNFEDHVSLYKCVINKYTTERYLQVVVVV